MSDFNSIKNLKKLFKQKTLLDVLIEVENFLDFMQLYVYPNWIEGEVVDGPRVSRYWVTLTLRYDYEKLPDPMGARVLHDIGVRVDFQRGYITKSVDVKSPADYVPGTKKPKLKKIDVWHVELKVPRRFIDNIDYNDLDDYDDDIDLDSIEQAKDDGVDSY